MEIRVDPSVRMDRLPYTCGSVRLELTRHGVKEHIHLQNLLGHTVVERKVIVEKNGRFDASAEMRERFLLNVTGEYDNRVGAEARHAVPGEVVRQFVAALASNGGHVDAPDHTTISLEGANDAGGEQGPALVLGKERDAVRLVHS